VSTRDPRAPAPPRGRKPIGSSIPSPEMRLFVAVELPAPIRESIERHVRSLPAIPNVRWSRTATHVTLRFLGETARERVSDLTTALANVRWAPFTVTLGAAGQFPSHGRARVLW